MTLFMVPYHKLRLGTSHVFLFACKNFPKGPRLSTIKKNTSFKFLLLQFLINVFLNSQYSLSCCELQKIITPDVIRNFVEENDVRTQGIYGFPVINKRNVQLVAYILELGQCLDCLSRRQVSYYNTDSSL